MNLELGKCYSRQEIAGMLGGSVQSFLPRSGGVVVAGCFRQEPRWNPDAPEEVTFGAGRDVLRDAELVAAQEQPIPVFMFRSAGAWEYVGTYKCTAIRTDPETCRRADLKNPAREGITGVLYFKRVGPS